MDYIKIRFVDNQEDTERDIFRTVEEMLHLAQPRFAFSRQRWQPHMDIYETVEEIVVIAEIAGIQSEGIDLEIAPRTLKISGKRSLMFMNREAAPPKAAGRYCLAEIPSGYFERTVFLTAPIDTATAETEYSNGLLKIRLTKVPPEGSSKITVTVKKEASQ
jgi:HSP20 family protein